MDAYKSASLFLHSIDAQAATPMAVYLGDVHVSREAGNGGPQRRRQMSRRAATLERQQRTFFLQEMHGIPGDQRISTVQLVGGREAANV